MKLVDEVCPMFGDLCRHCSDEVHREVVRFSVIKDCELGKKGHQGKRIRRIELGHFCNNDGKHFVKDMKYCPARWALTRPMSEEAKALVLDLLRKNASVIVSSPVKKAIRRPRKKSVKSVKPRIKRVLKE